MSKITESIELKVVVGEILDGKHGKFAVAFQRKGADHYPIPQPESITFSLKPECWETEACREPQKGEEVLVGGLTKHVSGWRAGYAKPIVPDCEPQETRNERSEL